MLRQVVSALTLAVSCSIVVAANPPPTPVPVSPRAVAPDASELINEAGRLRMLAERMGKAYAQLALNLMPDKAQEQLAQSQKHFEENLTFINRAPLPPLARVALDAIAASYRSYAKALALPPNKANVVAVHRLTDKIVTDAENLTAVFEGRAQASSAGVVNASGRQRMLSQRMARLYFAAALGNGKAGTEPYRTEFKNTLAALEASPLSNTQIRREIDLAKTQWMFFEQALLGRGDTASNLKNVATSSERLLETMDNLTSLYSKALRAVLGNLQLDTAS
ncbi:type IV pili methyl-accepting chemotaxis transducer N-terminal domain-containing protein [Noviherbaspirillum sp.]|uniref:type IV pili methyl-accepting chemotaxis transducer N-terminal domain-containing protein n=1 Tax=Noviherbaspirillum sp. TaxID=1926288 RepID=UPI002B46F75B|nr:type IV pili methyl-accepting chemotaxis transducer N-terminal domain-containing protein [Noviherbaspirillum sp.]HJV81157.1 type IV pili methyl-accepting chemotaxis transducer N-terminal domain-containing protein [Noviherbaspirillum sp.]